MKTFVITSFFCLFVFLLLWQNESAFAETKAFISELSVRQQGISSWMELAPAIDRSLRFAEAKSQKEPLPMLPKRSWADITFSLKLLRAQLPYLDENPDILLEKFEWIPLFTANEPFLFTGYYHPLLAASKTFREGYTPLYRLPKNSKKRRHERRAIQNGALQGQHLEIAWVRDAFEAFLLEVQGSGCLQYDDGYVECLRYAGQNGHPYKSSRRILEDHGLLFQSDIGEQRDFFKKNPQFLSLLAENPSYVFFQKTGETQAIGALNAPLSPWISVAVDRTVVPLGGILAIGTTFPNGLPFYGLMLAQDTGGAIKKRRMDIFCGATTYAADVAARLDAEGVAWLLLAKHRTPGK